MSYEVVLDEFQGPLDLLLHLIKEKEMDLESLEVSVITDQYLAYIDQMDPEMCIRDRFSINSYLYYLNTCLKKTDT